VFGLIYKIVCGIVTENMPEAFAPTPNIPEALVQAPMSNLQKVEAAFSANPSKIFVAGSLDYWSPDFKGYNGEPRLKRDNKSGFAEWAEYFIAPTIGAFEAKSLEKYRLELGQIFPPTDNIQQVSERSGGIGYGQFIYDDVLARVSSTTVSNVEEIEAGAVNELGLQIGQLTANNLNTLMRRILIRVVPHPVLALVLRNELGKVWGSDIEFAQLLEYSISDKQLAELKKLISHGSIGPNYALIRLLHAAKSVKYEEDMDLLEKKWPLGTCVGTCER